MKINQVDQPHWVSGYAKLRGVKLSIVFFACHVSSRFLFWKLYVRPRHVDSPVRDTYVYTYIYLYLYIYIIIHIILFMCPFLSGVNLNITPKGAQKWNQSTWVFGDVYREGMNLANPVTLEAEEKGFRWKNIREKTVEFQLWIRSAPTGCWLVTIRMTACILRFGKSLLYTFVCHYYCWKGGQPKVYLTYINWLARFFFLQTVDWNTSS